MTKFLMSAALVALTLTTAQAVPAARPTLPDSMMGAWCGSWGYQFDDDSASRYWHAEKVQDCANRGGFRISRDRVDYYRFGWKASCRFTAVNFFQKGSPKDHVRPKDSEGNFAAPVSKVPPSDIYVVEMTCKENGKLTKEAFYLQATDGWLIEREGD
jgi:hypothetical protein